VQDFALAWLVFSLLGLACLACTLSGLLSWLVWYACNTSVLDTILSGLAWLGLACLSDTPPRYRTKGGSGCPFAIFLFFIIFFIFLLQERKRTGVWECLLGNSYLQKKNSRRFLPGFGRKGSVTDRSAGWGLSVSKMQE